MTELSAASEQVRIEWFVGEDEGKARLEEQAQRLREADPDADVEVVDPAGILPIVGWIIAGITLLKLAREIADLACRIRKDGIIIDARQDPLKIREVSSLPGGTVIVIGKDGSASEYNVCEGTDLAEIIKSARS